MMKKTLLVSSAILIILASCSESSNVTYTGAGTETLKQVVQNKEESAIWTRELESVRLTKNIRQIDSVSDSISLSPDVMKLAGVQGEKIYPVIKDFGSLDVSEIPQNVYDACKRFSDSFSGDLYSVQSYFNSSAMFSYVFLLDDLKRNFFDGELPRKSDRSEEDSDDEDDFVVFNRYIIGKAYESGDELQVPIRFYRYSNYFDATIFISVSTSKISQIKIDRYVKM